MASCFSVRIIKPIESVQRIGLLNLSKFMVVPINISNFSVRLYHNTTILMAKPKKGSKSTDEDLVRVVLPDMKRFDGKMEDKISLLVEEFSKIRGGRTNPDMFKTIMVSIYYNITYIFKYY